MFPKRDLKFHLADKLHFRVYQLRGAKEYQSDQKLFKLLVGCYSGLLKTSAVDYVLIYIFINLVSFKMYDSQLFWH